MRRSNDLNPIRAVTIREEESNIYSIEHTAYWTDGISTSYTPIFPTITYSYEHYQSLFDWYIYQDNVPKVPNETSNEAPLLPPLVSSPSKPEKIAVAMVGNHQNSHEIDRKLEECMHFISIIVCIALSVRLFYILK